MNLNGRIERLERELPPDVCHCQPAVVVRDGEPGQPTGPVPPCPMCGLEPMVIRIVRVQKRPPGDQA
jgi:hypothetical protein